MNKIIAVITALIIALSACCVRAEAFEFGGSDRTKQEALADWFEALKEFAKDPVNKADDMVKANGRLNVDMIALGYEDQLDRINGITSGFVLGYDKFNDEALNQLTELLNKYGIDTPKQQFEDWYQTKYGKEYYNREFPVENLKKNNYQYYIKSDCGRYYRWVFFNSTRTVFDVKDFNNSGHKFIYVADVTDGYAVTKYKDGSSSSHGEYDPNGGYYGLDVNPNQYSSGKVLDHNLPLNYWGDILEPSGNIDDIFDEFGEGEGAGLTPDEFDDFLSDLLNDLKDSMPDLTTVEGILQAIYRKCCSIDGKMNKQDKSNIKSLIDAAVVSLSTSNKEGVDRIIEALGKLSGDVDNGNYDDEELLENINGLKDMVSALGFDGEALDLDVASMSPIEKAKTAALSDLIKKINKKIPIIKVNTSINTIKTVVYNDEAPKDLVVNFSLFDKNVSFVFLSSAFFSQPNVANAVLAARNFSSCVIFCVWLLAMRKKLVNIV